MVDGFYRITFTGLYGSGFGLLVLSNCAVAGADVGGALYDGLYELDESGKEIVVRVTMRAPAGITPVQTGVPLIVPADIPIIVTIPVDLAGGAPVLVQTPLGKVNIILTKIRDL